MDDDPTERWHILSWDGTPGHPTRVLAAADCDGIGVVAAWLRRQEGDPRGPGWDVLAASTEDGDFVKDFHEGEPVPPEPPTGRALARSCAYDREELPPEDTGPTVTVTMDPEDPRVVRLDFGHAGPMGTVTTDLPCTCGPDHDCRSDGCDNGCPACSGEPDDPALMAHADLRRRLVGLLDTVVSPATEAELAAAVAPHGFTYPRVHDALVELCDEGQLACDFVGGTLYYEIPTESSD